MVLKKPAATKGKDKSKDLQGKNKGKDKSKDLEGKGYDEQSESKSKSKGKQGKMVIVEGVEIDWSTREGLENDPIDDESS